jgi:hypothetical protein
LTGDVMYYCPSCEVLLGQSEAYEHTYSHRERGANTSAVIDSFKQIPVAEPTTGPWKDDRDQDTASKQEDRPR